MDWRPAAAALLIAACAPRPPAQPTAPSAWQSDCCPTQASAVAKYGVNQDLAWDPREQVGPEIALMRAAGVQWVRLPVRWYWVEPQPGAARWDAIDAIISALHEAGLEILAVLGSTPTWSSGVAEADVEPGVYWDAYEPASVADFANYVNAVVSRYRGRVRAYEIFNEPNSFNHWRPAPDAARYVEFLCAGYRAVKAADADALVVVGGLNGNGLFLGWEPPEGRDFLPAIYAGGGADCFDVMAIHPFAHPVEDGLAGLQAWVDATLAAMQARGDARELWLTEVGWGAGPEVWGHTAITEGQQAEWVEAVYRDLRGPQKVFWYNFKDVGADPANAEHGWGWLRFDLRPKPAYHAFMNLSK